MSERDRSLNSLQIMRYYGKNQKFGGVLCKNELKNKSPNSKFWIVNMEDSDKGGGSHWICVIDTVPGEIYYVDSFGLPPPLDIISFMKRAKGKTRYWSDAQYQGLTSTSCGYYCIYVIDKILSGEPMRRILSKDLDEKNLPSNEKRLKQHL